MPRSNFFWTNGGSSPGAWEFKARYSRLNLNDINRGEYNDYTFGVNWYWTDRTRIMFDWIHPETTVAARPFGAVNADIIGIRFDTNW